MNNTNNSSRVVINLDGSLDEFDDDDITLPSMPAQSVAIVDEPDVATVEDSKDIVDRDLSSVTAVGNIALGAPLIRLSLIRPNLIRMSRLRLAITMLKMNQRKLIYRKCRYRHS